MANHKSAKKRIRQTVTKTLLNRYKYKTTRNAIRDLRKVTDKKEAEKIYPKVVAMLDKLSKCNIIHKNKSSNLKSKLKLHINHLDSESTHPSKPVEKKPTQKKQIADTKIKKSATKKASPKESLKPAATKKTIAKKNK